MSLEEYQSQLSDIELLLAESPEDESLLKLKSDLLELIELTAEQDQEQEGIVENDAIDNDNDNDAGSVHGAEQQEDGTSMKEQEFTSASAAATGVEALTETALSSNEMTEAEKEKETASSSTTTISTTAATTKPKMSMKKSKKILSKPFEIPSHLIPLDSDTDAERKRKKRAARALKAQYKSTQKTVESQVKQQSWQDFNKKTKKKRKGTGGSIFKTEDGIGARVGVISGSVRVMGQERTDGKGGSNVSSGNKKQRHLF